MWREKILSGRFLLTCSSAVIFAYCSFKGVLSAEGIAAILSTVFTSYFNKPKSDRKENV